MWARQFVGRIAVARRTRQTLQSESRDVASRRQDSDTGRLRRLIASCGIERWDQRAGEQAAVLRKHPVVVSRWVSEASRIRSEDQAFAVELDDLDRLWQRRRSNDLQISVLQKKKVKKVSPGTILVSFLLPIATSFGMRSVATALSRGNAVFAKGGTCDQ